MTVAILTISDSTAAGKREDGSGPALEARCATLGWKVVARAVAPDETNTIAKHLTTWADRNAASLILTTGGTGVSARDVTPEATRAVIEREIPGIGELMRSAGLQKTKYSVLSRGLAGTRAKSLIVNLPGAPRGAVQSLDSIAHLAAHVVDLLEGRTEHGRPTSLKSTR